MKITMKAALLAATLTALSALPAQAQQVVTASVNARAGLAPLTSVTCDDVNFGVWRVPVRSTGGTSIVTLTVSANTAAGVTTAAVTGNTSNVAVAGGYIVPTAATCVVSGATNISTTLPTAISNNIGLSFGSSTHESLRVPPTLATLSANLSLAGTGVAVDATGAGAFRVVGELTIPQAILAANYGGYRTSTAATVSVTDAL